jgi:hypothetical protein
VLVPVGLGVAVAASKRLARRRRLGAADPGLLAVGIRDEIADQLGDRGLRVHRGVALRELSLVAERTGTSLRRLTQLLATARYGPPELAHAAATEARVELDVVERAIKRGESRPRTLLALVRPRVVRGPTGDGSRADHKRRRFSR